MQAMIKQDGGHADLRATSFGYFDPHMLKLAADNPNVRFAHCGGLWTEGKHPKNAASYFGYIDERAVPQRRRRRPRRRKSQEDRLRRRQADPAGAAQHQRLRAGRAQSIDPTITRPRGLHRRPGRCRSRNPRPPTAWCRTRAWTSFTCHVDGPEGRHRDGREARRHRPAAITPRQAKLAPEGYLTGAEWNWLCAVHPVRQGGAGAASRIERLPASAVIKEGFVKMSPCGKRRPLAKAAKAAGDAAKAAMIEGRLCDLQGTGMEDNEGNVGGRRPARRRRPSTSNSRR
jgi:simple sugar transport system substrate-binding protein